MLEGLSYDGIEDDDESNTKRIIEIMEEEEEKRYQRPTNAKNSSNGFKRRARES